MKGLSDAHHFRKTVAGYCMVLAPLFLLAAAIIGPAPKTDEADQVASAAANADAWYVASLFTLIAVVLAVPAVLGLMHMLRERETAFGHIGGGLAMIGLLAFVGLTAMSFVVWQMAAGDRGEMVALLERTNDTTGIVIPFFVMAFGFMAGLCMLAFGLHRAHAIHWWMAGALVLGAIALTVTMFVASEVLTVVMAALMVIGFAPIGRMVLGESDDAWEHTPEIEGFRPPIAGT